MTTKAHRNARKLIRIGGDRARQRIHPTADESIIQVRTVVLIALLALSRKLVILDITATGAATIAALASATLALGIVFWLLSER